MIKIIDPRRKLCILEKERLIPFLVDHFYETLFEVIRDKQRFNVALAGGSTPKNLYQAICLDKRFDLVDWSKVHFYFGDERSCDLTESDSNYKMAMDSGFNRCQGANIYPMNAFKKNEQAALDYQKHLPQTLDLIYLGMGEDGHTASLFPNDPMLKVQDKHVAIGFVESKQTYRMTLTLPYINQSTQILILTQGASKKEKLHEVLSESGSNNPIFFIGTKQHPSLYVTDTQTY
jgi:6-phosphogluconolactonase